MARSLRACAAAALVASSLFVSPTRAGVVHSTPPLRPASWRSAGPVRVYRFVLTGPLAAARSAAAVIVDVSDHCWTAREFGFVEVALPAGIQPNVAASGGIAWYNDEADRFEALGLEP